MLYAFDPVLPDNDIRQFDAVQETELLIALRSDQHSMLQWSLMIVERDVGELARAHRPTPGSMRFGKDQYGFTRHFGRLLGNQGCPLLR